MGVKSLQCFPWYGRRKERKRKQSEEEPPLPPSPAEKPTLQTSLSVSSDTDAPQNRAYFSGKAGVSFRHEMDSTMSANYSTF
ncbi:uncharacterized protein C17orf114 homolog [Ascaphus truei]|uniref:uncharacterized protein C17orf114 homolog n=1 Tax=Ascaphus truei TaxID=8439 RepID=UPI003F5929E4